jgi:hypothetical protein
MLAGTRKGLDPLHVEECETAPNRASSRSTSELPPLTMLIRREQERETLSALLQRSEVRLLTLTGTGDVGQHSLRRR